MAANQFVKKAVDKMGGKYKAAHKLCVSWHAVHSWMERGFIPAKYWHKIHELEPDIPAEHLAGWGVWEDEEKGA